MPRAHKYKRKEGYYVRTNVKSRPVTYQLTDNGVKSLGLDGRSKQVDRAELARLIASGDAYTGGSGPGDVQLPPQPKLTPKAKPQPKPSAPLFTRGSKQPFTYYVPSSPPPPPAPHFRSTPKVLEYVTCRMCGCSTCTAGAQKCWRCGADAIRAFEPLREEPEQTAEPELLGLPDETPSAIGTYILVPLPTFPTEVGRTRDTEGSAVPHKDPERARRVRRPDRRGAEGSAVPHKDPEREQEAASGSDYVPDPDGEPESSFLTIEILAMELWLWLVVLIGAITPTVLVYKAIVK